MSLEIKVGPPQLAIHQGHAVLLSEPDGQINWPSEKGLYFYDTRVVSSWTVYANGEPWDLLNSGTTTCLTARVFLTNRDIVTEEGPIAQHTLGLVLSRHIDGGVHEDHRPDELRKDQGSLQSRNRAAQRFRRHL